MFGHFRKRLMEEGLSEELAGEVVKEYLVPLALHSLTKQQ